jgi:hypothetical protein
MPMSMPNLLVGRDVTIYSQNNTGVSYKLGYTTGVNACGALFFGVVFWRFNKLRRAPNMPDQGRGAHQPTDLVQPRYDLKARRPCPALPTTFLNPNFTQLMEKVVICRVRLRRVDRCALCGAREFAAPLIHRPATRGLADDYQHR